MIKILYITKTKGPMMTQSSSELPTFEPKPLRLMRPEDGEVITPERARHEHTVGKATALRTAVISEWGPKPQNDEALEDLRYSE